ncbi:MAG TPA: S9 family peptidase [Thermoanaerobaculia bacterium]|nr:S9 family peptidase [Thermoanaerobaculia bacterium]
MSNPAFSIEAEAPAAPDAPRIPKILRIHGETLVDDYAWLRDRANPQVIAHLEAEDAYADAVMSGSEPLQQALYEEMVGRIRETDVNVPWPMGEWKYYSRTEEGKQYSIICRTREGFSGEEILLDLNELAAGHDYLSLGDLEVTDDGNLLAYSLDFTGLRRYTLFVKDLRDGALLGDRIEDVSSVSWAADGRTLFYVSEDAARRPWQLWKHRLGETGRDVLVFEEPDALFRIWVTRSRSKSFLFMTSASATTSEVRLLRSEEVDGDWRLIEPRAEGHEYYVDHRGGRFYILTNDRGKNFRLASAPIGRPSAAAWDEVIAHRDSVKIEEIEIFANHLVVIEREGGVDQFRVIDLRDGSAHRILFREPAYSAAPSNNRIFETTRFRLAYESFVTPLTVYDYDMETRELVLLKETEVLGGYDPLDYVSERLTARAPDGTEVPISLVRRRDLDPGRPHPLVLYGYGAYGSPLPVTFSSNRLSLLDRGLVFATAHVRGGGEMGKEWHEQGMMELKTNSFADFIACAEFMIARGSTAPDRLVAVGASAGGLLVAAALNARPELFHSAVLQVPFVDVVNTMLDPSLPLTVGEYLEWGNPNIEAEFRTLRAYDPYLNVESKDYPAVLIRTSFNDSQVMYWEAAKYAARLRATRTGERPTLLKVNLDAGHSGASGRYDRLREVAFNYAFVLSQVGFGRNDDGGASFAADENG